MKYVATKPAFYDGHRVKEGEVFEGPEDLKGRWFVREDEFKPQPKTLMGMKIPETISELARMAPAPPPATSRGRKPAQRASDQDVLKGE